MIGHVQLLVSAMSRLFGSTLGMTLLAICGVVDFPSPTFAQGPDDFTIATWRYYCASALEHPNSDACIAALSGRAAATPSTQNQSYVVAEPTAPRADQETRVVVDSSPVDVREVHSDTPWKTAGINVGFIVTSNTTKLRLDSRTLGRGIELDLEDVFGFDKTTTGARLDAYWRFFPRHKLHLAYYDISREGSRTASRSFQFGDRVFNIGVDIQTEFDFSILQADYTYSVYQDEKWDLGLSLGLHAMDVEVSVTANNLGFTASAETIAPLPVAGLEASYAITPRWFLRGRSDFFYVEFGDYEGHLFDAIFSLEYDFLDYAGPRFTNQVQHRYAPELRWASTMTSSILMIVSRYLVCMRTGYLAARLAA